MGGGSGRWGVGDWVVGNAGGVYNGGYACLIITLLCKCLHNKPKRGILAPVNKFV